MKRVSILFIALFLVSLASYSQPCNYPTTKKVLLVGDSWGNFMWAYRSHKEAFEKFGFSDFIEEGAGTVENGSEADDFIQNPKLSNVINSLNNNPSIEWVLLSLGGNDVLGDWHKNFTPAQNDSLLDTLEARLNILLDTIFNTRPGINILISGYDYPNFGETCFLVPTGAYADLFSDMGNPSFTEINGVLTLLMQRFEEMAQNRPGLHLVSNLGLMQYVFGQSTALIVPPYLPAYAPGTVTLPGGNSNYPSPRAAMLLNIDAFHINQDAFRHFAARQTELFFWSQFRRNRDTSFTAYGGFTEGTQNYDGSISHGVIATGNSNDNGATSCIFTFDTQAIPDNASITSARLFLTRSSVTGQNPLVQYGSTAPELDIKTGFFGACDSIESADFAAAADAVNVACLIGVANDNGHKIRFEILDSAALQYINKTGTTQFRLRINAHDAQAAHMIAFFNSAAQGHNKPVLDVKYTLSTTTEPPPAKQEALVYPNPANIIVNVSATGLTSVTLYTAGGKLLTNIQASTDMLSLSLTGLPPGLYLLKIHTKEKCEVRKLIKTFTL